MSHPVDAVLDTSVIIDFERIDGTAVAGACGRWLPDRTPPTIPLSVR